MRVLSAESVARMRSVIHDMGTPNRSPVGVGWLVRSPAGTPVLTMFGSSPGGVAALVVLPEHDLVFAAYGNDPRRRRCTTSCRTGWPGGSAR